MSVCSCGCEALNGIDSGCDFVTYKRFGNNPTEYCDQPTTPGTDQCQQHQGDASAD